MKGVAMRERMDLVWGWKLTELRLDGVLIHKDLLPTYTEIMLPDETMPYFSLKTGLGHWTISNRVTFTIKPREE